jgi:hypothetical protein
MLQFELGIAVFLLSLVVCSIMTFLRSLQVEEMAMTSKPRKVDTVECCNFFIFLCCIKSGFSFLFIYVHMYINPYKICLCLFFLLAYVFILFKVCGTSI